MNKPILTAATAGALLLGAFAVDVPEAAADVRVHLGGGVSVRTTPRVRWSRPAARAYYRPRYAVGGAIWVGGGYYSGYNSYRTYAAPPPPPSCECGPGAVPSYYPGYYQQAPAQYYVAPPETRTLPRFALGGFASGTATDSEETEEYGLLARYRLRGGWIVEGEIGGSRSSNHDGDVHMIEDNSRVAAGLVYELGAQNTWAPYLVGSVGSTTSSGADSTRGFGELGIGLRWALSDNLHLTADIRAGARERQTDSFGEPLPLEGAAARVVTPIGPDDENGEGYTRARLSAMFYF